MILTLINKTKNVIAHFMKYLSNCRRVIHTLDPQWPGVTLYGTLPKIVVHVTEQKVRKNFTFPSFTRDWMSHIMNTS